MHHPILLETPCNPISSNELNGEKGQARDFAAHKVGLSPTTYYRAKTILEKGTPELQEEVRTGETSISDAFNKVMTKLNKKPKVPTVSLPKGNFDIIYADPPWRYEVNHLRGSPEDHYETMAIEEICKLPIPSSENAVLFLWATNPLLEDALKVMTSWGFKYKTNLVWVKNHMGVGFWLRGQHELLLIGVKGEVHPPEAANRLSSVLQAEVKKHSEKPEQIYGIIESMFPTCKFLELFARNKREHWEVWGNEV